MTLRVLGLIPARAGSKGVPGKNERPLGGRSLVERARDAAVDSGAIERLVLSTDSDSIADAGRALGIDVPFLRPAELADDRSPMLAVVEQHDLYGDRCLPLVLEPDEVLTIDTPEDWHRAEQRLGGE